MRKVLSFVLVLALVLGSFSMAFATVPADVVGTPNEAAVNVLMGLGVVNGYEDGSYKPDNIVTRAEMAKLIVVALGMEDYAVGTSDFPDMAGAQWAQKYVGYAVGLGVIKGYPDGTFKPSQTVTYDEAAAMIVRALGYTDGSLLPATWPANYVVKAKALGILDDVKASAAGANRGDIAQMLYNALTVDFVSVDADNKITVNEDDNMIIRLGATVKSDVVVYGTEDTLINLVEYTGSYGDVYYNDDDEVVAVDVASDSITGDYIAASGIVNASTSDDTDYNVSATVASKSVPYFWNGVEEPANKYHSKYSVDTVTSATGDNIYAVDLSGKRIADVYAISYWQVSSDDLFEARDAKDIADDESLFGHDFILDDNDEIDYNQFVIEGAKSLADIKTDNVVYVYNGYDDAGIKKIQVGTEVVTGEVTEVDEDEYTINGKVYELAVNEVSDKDGLYNPGKPEVGDTIEARLDYFGYIYDFDVVDSTADLYGVVTARGADSFKDPIFKILTSDDSEKNFDLELDDLVATDVAITTVGSLIGYGLDANGVIDELAVSTTASSAKVHSVNIFSYKTTSGAVEKYVDVASDVVVFSKDASGDYELIKIGDVQTTTGLAVGFQFILNEDGDELDALYVVNSDSEGTSDDIFAVLNSVTKVKDGDDTVYKLTGFAGGAAYTALMDNDTDADLKDAGSVVDLFTLDPKTDGTITDAAKTGIWNNGKGFVTDVNSDGTVLTIGTAKLQVEANAVVYEAVMDGTSLDYYQVSSLKSIDEGHYVWLYQVDSENDYADTVIFADDYAAAVTAADKAATDAAFAKTTVTSVTVTDLAGYANNGKINVTWAALANATSYKVAVSGTAITTTVTTNSAVLSGLTSGASVTVIVTGYNVNGQASVAGSGTATVQNVEPVAVKVTYVSTDKKTIAVSGGAIYTAKADTVVYSSAGAIIGIGEFTGVTTSSSIIVYSDVNFKLAED